MQYHEYLAALMLVWVAYFIIPTKTFILYAVITTLTLTVFGCLQYCMHQRVRTSLLWFSLLFGFVTVILGEGYNLYEQYEHYDAVLHAVFGFVSGVVVTIIFAELQGSKRIKLPRWLLLVLAWCVVVTIGTLWELVESFVDQWFVLSMQPSLEDTMHDIRLNVGFALLGVVGSIGIVYRQLPGLSSVATIFRSVLFRTPTK